MGIRVGIDLGTTYSAVSWINPKTQQPEMICSDAHSDLMITPSEVWFRPDGSVLCGADAKEAFENGEVGVANTFKRFMGTSGPCFYTADGEGKTAEELSAILLRHLKEQAERHIGQPIDGAVITVPAYFEDEPRASTRAAAEQAGLHVIDIISEPTAAALNYGMGHWRENALILVYDLGGGTFDVTLVAMGKDRNLITMGTMGDHRRGGRDWDKALADLIVRKLRDELGLSVEDDLEVMNELTAGAEEWKQKLTKSPSVRVRVPGMGAASVTVTREEFDEATEDLLEQTGSLCDHLLEELHVSWGQVTDVLLVGGSTRMPQVSRFLTERLRGRQPIAHVNPDQAVAMGAAICANIARKADLVAFTPGGDAKEEVRRRSASLLQQTSTSVVKPSQTIELSSIRFQDAVAHAMGIVLVNAEETAYVNETIIPANAPVPCKYSRATLFDSRAGEMEIYVLQGSGPIDCCTVSAKYVASGITRTRDPLCTMHVQYSYDAGHMIHVQVRQDDGTEDLPLRKEPFTQEDIARFMLPYEKPKAPPASEAMAIVMAIDVSGSMDGSPIRLAKEAMEKFTYDFEGMNVAMGVLMVSNRCAWTCRPTQDLEKVRAGIRKVRVGATGGGNTDNPFRDILAELRHRRGPKYAIVLADGAWLYQSKAIEDARKCHAAKIDVIGMGFGDADEAFMRAISTVDTVMTTDAQLGLSFGKIARSLGAGSGAALSTARGGLFQRKKQDAAPKARSWETVMELDKGG